MMIVIAAFALIAVTPFLDASPAGRDDGYSASIEDVFADRDESHDEDARDS